MEFINKFKNYLLSQKDSASLATVKNYLADVKQFISWVEGTYKNPFTPQAISIQTINEFKTEKAQVLSASSLERHISSLRKFFTFLKLDGQIGKSPFDQITSSADIAKADPWHLHEFKNYLYVYNASRLTIKNYLIDVKQFLTWAEEVLRVNESWHVTDKNVFSQIDNALVEEYKHRLLHLGAFSASSINRKLSSLRKYLSWAAEQGYLQPTVSTGFANTTNLKEIVSDVNEKPFIANNADENEINAAKTNQSQTKYSKIPPIRLFQKLGRVSNSTFDLLIVSPIASLFQKVEHGRWVAQGKPIFKHISHFPIPVFTNTSARLHDQNSRLRFKTHVTNISKDIYAPLSISTKHFSWYKKLLFHIRHTRPQWYHKYHEIAIAHYFNWAVLIIFSAAIGFGMYNSFVQKPDKSLAALPTAGKRILSFQGRLTDANDNPITSPSWIRFVVYNDVSASGSARLWEEVDKVSPDQDGIFSLNLGSDGAGGQAALCNAGNPPASPATSACGIPQNLFAQNSALWLGVTVEATAELQPREQIATVAYAVNSETLQGLPPITQSGAGTQNVVLALNSSGNLSIGGSTTFQATTGNFTLSGNTLVLNTNPGTNGNITIAPDGQGFIDIQKPLQNSTLNNNISSAAGAVEIDDLMAILATSSGQSALTINQNGAGPIISASASGNAKFTVDNAGNTTANAFYTGLGTTYYINSATSNLNSLTLAGNLTVSGNVASNLIPSINDTYSLGSDPNASGKEWLNLYVKNIYSNGQALSQLWQRNAGVVSPLNTTDDLAIGGTATGAAKFQVFGLTGNATTSGNFVFGGASVNNLIAARNNAGLTIGDAQTGNIILSPQGGTGLLTLQGNFNQTGATTFTTGTGLTTIGGNLTVNGTTQTVGNGSDFSLTTTGNGNLNLFSSGTGNITLGQNAGIGNVVVQPNAGGQAGFIVNKQGPNGDIITASTSGTTQFTVSRTGGVYGRIYYDLDNTNFFLDPASATNSLLVAGTVGIGTLNPLLQSGLDIEKNALGNATQVVNQLGNGDIFTASSSGVAKFTIQNDGTLVSGKYTAAGGVLYTNGSGVFAQASNASANTVLHGGSTPSFSAVDLANDTTGVLALSRGGTGANITGDQGGIVYFNTNTTLTTLAHTATSGQCLISGGTGAPSWAACATGGAGTNYWQLIAGAISPIYPSVDLLVGSSSTSSAKFAVNGISGSLTPTASVSATVASGGTGTGIVLKGDGSIQSLINSQLTIGGNTTGNITLSPLAGSGNVTIDGTALNTTSGTFDLINTTASTVRFAGAATSLTIGAAGAGTTTFRNNTIDDNQSSITLFGTPTSVTFAGAATTLSLGNASGTTTINNNGTINGNTVLGTNTGNTVTIKGLVNQNVLPSATTINLGDPTHYWGTVYAQNFIAPVSGGTSGFWQLTSSVLSPVNAWNDLAVGGNATGSATPWQVFATTVGVNTAGTATSSGNLAFRGANTKINLLNGSDLTIQASPGGDTGLASIVNISPTGNLTINGNAAINGGTISTTNTNANIFTSGVTSLNIGNSSTTTNLKGDVTFGTSGSNGISFTGVVNTNILPSTVGGPYNLGTINNRWGDIYARNLFLPVSGGTAGYWTLSNSVLSPTNNWNDLAIGGTATGSAAFQVFANAVAGEPAGTATTSGNISFKGTPGSQTVFKNLLLNGSNFGFYPSVGGDAGSGTPALYIANTSSIGIGTNNPSYLLHVRGANASTLIDDTGAGGAFLRFNSNSTTGAIGYNQDAAGALELFTGGTSSTNSRMIITSTGSVGIATTNPLSSTGLDIEKNGLGNSVLVANQTGLGDIFTASASGVTKFTIANDGTIKNSLIPSANNTYNLGSDPNANGKEWDTLYVRQIISPVGGGTAGYWQLSNQGVLAPANITNDLAVGGTATGSATPFQIFAQSYTNNFGTVPAGTATTSGNFTFRGTPGSQTAFQTNILNGASLGFYNSVGGDKGVNTSLPTLYLANIGNVGIGSNSAQATLDIYSTQAAMSARSALNTNMANDGVYINTWQRNALPLGDIYHNNNGPLVIESSANTTLGTTNNIILNPGTGNVGIGTISPQGILDVASNKTNLPSDLTLGQAQGTNLMTNPSFETGTTSWALSQGGTGGSIAQSSTQSIFGSKSLLITTGTAWTTLTNSSAITVSSSTTYTFSAWVKTSIVNNVQLDVFDNGTSTHSFSSLHTGDGKWQRLTVTFTTGLSTTSIFATVVSTGANGTTAYVDGVQLEKASSVSPYIDGSLGSGYHWTGAANASTSVRDSGATLAYNTLNSASGIGAASIGTYPTLQLDQNGTGDIIAASAAGVLQFQVTNTGNVISRKFTDLDNQSYFLDPAATANQNSLIVGGRVGIGTTNPLDTLAAAGNTNIGSADSNAWAATYNAYNYRQAITVNNSNSTLTNYQVKVIFDTASLVTAGKMQSSCQDLRFADSSGNALNFWVESGCNTRKTQAWVLIPSLANGSSKIYAYYGNGGASSASSITGAFPSHGDDFSGGSLSGIWTTANTDANRTIGVSSGTLNLSCATAQNCDWWVSTYLSPNAQNTIPAGDWEARVYLATYNDVVNEQQGPFLVNGSQNAYFFGRYHAGANNLNIDTLVANSGTGAVGSAAVTTTPIYFAIRKSGTTYTFLYSTDNINWTSMYTTSSLGFVPTAIALSDKKWTTTASVAVSYDNFYIRNYTATEPTISAYGAEQNQSLISSKFFVDTVNGNVGIDTTNPASGYAVHAVQNSSSSNGLFLAENLNPTNYAMYAMRVADGEEYRLGVGGPNETSLGVANSFFLFDNNAGAMRMIVNSSGVMGLGLIPNTSTAVSLQTNKEITTGEGAPVLGCATLPNGGYSFVNDGCWDSGLFQPTADGMIGLYQNANLALAVSGNTVEIGGSTEFDTGAAGGLEIRKDCSGCQGGTLVIANKIGATNTAASLAFGTDSSNNQPQGGDGPNAEIRAVNKNGGVANATDLQFYNWDGSTYQFNAHLYSNGNFNIRGGYGTGNPPDVAEGITTSDTSISAGDIVNPDTTTKDHIIKANQEYDGSVIGVISTKPAIIINNMHNLVTETTDPLMRPLVIAGRIPLKVWSKNGQILVGDRITSSSLPGFGTKAVKAGSVVAKAVEAFNPSDATCTLVSSADAIVWPTDDGFNPAKPCFKLPDGTYVGKIMALLNMSWYDPDIYLTSTGNVHMTDAQPSTDFTIPHYYTLNDALGGSITRMGAFLELAVGNLRAGSINAQQIMTNSLAIATANVTVAGQSLHDYIISVVKDAGLTGNGQVAQSDSVKTNVISPLGNGHVTIRLKDSGIEIAKDASSSAVASIDNNGNATFSGQLNSQNLAINGDATVSGTLHANRIEANNIVGLQAAVSTLSAQNITNVTNIYFATPSATPTAPTIATGFGNSSSPSSSLLASNNFTDIASFSAYFSYVPNLKAATGMFTENLTSLGATSLGDTTINGQLAIGSQLILANTSVNVLGADFAIQPLRQGGVSFEGGLIAIDTSGNLTVNGNATFNGNVAVNTLSPIAGHDLNVKLTDSSQFTVQNASGSGVFAVNQLGDVVASGTANIAKLNFNLVQPALAVSDIEVVASGSAGTAAIKPHQREVTIDNPTVTAQSLIYITPVGTDQTPYLERQISGNSFTVGIPTAQNNAVNFNWLIVN